MIRRELGIGRYTPSTSEVERVKEEFGLTEWDCNTNLLLRRWK